MVYAPTVIDLSRLPAPEAIEVLDGEALYEEFQARFISAWDELRAKDPTLPSHDTILVEHEPAAALGQAASSSRRNDRARVNDGIKALLAAFAKRTDLDALVARNNIERLTAQAATETTEAIYESDEKLLYRYLLSFDGRSAGSAERYMFEAHTALPILPIGGLAVNGHRVHGRRGDIDLVASGPGGRALTDEEMATLRLACLADHVVPETTDAVLLPAEIHEYRVRQTIHVSAGPSPAVLAQDAQARVRAVTDKATLIGSKVIRDFIAGAVSGGSILDAVTHEPAADIIADRYTVPVCTSIEIAVEVLS